MMKLALAAGVALAAVTLAASASAPRIVVRHHGGAEINIDANSDGWVTRAEASSAADRIFDEMDSNNDGRLDAQDRAERHIRIHTGRMGDSDGDDHVRIIRRGELDAETRVEIERTVREAHRAAERAEREAERASEDAEREAERAEREAERAERHIERLVERGDNEHRVIIIRRESDDDHEHGEDEEDHVMLMAPPEPPLPPEPPHPPMFMMLIANSEEADLNNDGALSRDEFRAQHMRFFDASDANGDGRVRFDPPEPPEPPEAPEAPTPPTPPRSHH